MISPYLCLYQPLLSVCFRRASVDLPSGQTRLSAISLLSYLMPKTARNMNRAARRNCAMGRLSTVELYTAAYIGPERPTAMESRTACAAKSFPVGGELVLGYSWG